MNYRPYVQIENKNIVNELKEELQKVLPNISQLPGIIGITLNGGLSRGYADELSEIDITIFLETTEFKKWNNEISPITLGITKINNYLYDIKILDYDEEMKKQWGDIEQWDLSYAEILFDPYKKIKKLFDDKLRKKIDLNKAEGFMMACWWHYKLAGDIWIKRKDPLQGHMMLNEAVNQLVKSLFVANEEFIPHGKWLIHLSYSLEWKPENWKDRILKSLDTSDFSIAGLKKRQNEIEKLWKEIDKYLNEKYFQIPIHIMQKRFFNLLKILIENEPMEIEEWNKHSTINTLNNDPFHKIVKIVGSKIFIDKKKLNNIKPEEMYKWHFEVLDAVRNIK